MITRNRFVRWEPDTEYNETQQAQRRQPLWRRFLQWSNKRPLVLILLFLVLVALPLALPLLQNAYTTRTRFRSDTGRFSIWMPADIQQPNDVVIRTRFNHPIDFHTFLAPAAGAYWLVQYADYPPDVIAVYTSNQILQDARDLLLQDAYGKLQAEQTVVLGRNEGREIVAASARRDPSGGVYDGTFKARLYLVGSRLYLVSTYVFNENWDNNLEKMNTFLSSFQVYQ